MHEDYQKLKTSYHKSKICKVSLQYELVDVTLGD